MPLSSSVSKIIGAILEAIIGMIVLVSGYLVTDIDPSDPLVRKTKEAAFTNELCDIPVQELYCPTDKSYVLNNSKHCKRCNRCTEDFDHHCKWVNNDVGKANYKQFLVLILSVTAFLIVYMACGISLTIDYGKDSYLLENYIYIYSHNSEQILSIMIILWVLMFFSGIFLFMALNLVLLHIYLIYKGITTYQYIIAGDSRRVKSQEAKTKNEERQSKKVCMDFILCLKKRRVASQGTLTLNADTQKSVDKELNNNSDNRSRKLSDFFKKEEAKAALDNTQNEENVDPIKDDAPRTHTIHSCLENDRNSVKTNKIFVFDKNNTDGSDRVLMPKSKALVGDITYGISPGRRSQESAHKVQAANSAETHPEDGDVRKIGLSQEKIKTDIPFFSIKNLNQMKVISSQIEKKSTTDVRESNHTIFAEAGKFESFLRLPEARGELTIKNNKKYEIHNSSLENKSLGC